MHDHKKRMVDIIVFFVLLILGIPTFACATVVLPNPPPPPDPKLVAAYIDMAYYDGHFVERANRIMSNGTLALDDELFVLKFCPATSALICMHADLYDYDFAIPRHSLKVGDEWSFDGKQFKLVPSEVYAPPAGILPNSENPYMRSALLGQELKIFVVAQLNSKTGRPNHLFFFSFDRGLIAEANPAEGELLRPSWLASRFGPGSQKYDSQIWSQAFLTKSEVDALRKRTIGKNKN